MADSARKQYRPPFRARRGPQPVVVNHQSLHLHGPIFYQWGPPMYFASPGLPGWEPSGAFCQTHQVPPPNFYSQPPRPLYQSTENRAWEPHEFHPPPPLLAPYHFEVIPQSQTLHPPPFSRFPTTKRANDYSGLGPLALPRLQIEQQGSSCMGVNPPAPPHYPAYVWGEPNPLLSASYYPQQDMYRNAPVPYEWERLDETDSMVEGCVKNPLQTPTTRKSAPLVATAPEFVPLSAQKNEKQAQNQENLKSKSSSSLPAASTKKYAPVFAKKVVPVVSPEPTFVISLKPDPNASVEESLRTVAEYNRKYPNSARAQIYAQMLGPETVLPPIREPKPTPQKPKPAPQNTKPNFLRALQDPAIADKVGLSLSDPQNPYTSKNQSNSKKAGRRLVDVWFSNHSRPDEQSTTPMMDDSDESDPYSPGPVPFDIQTLPIVNKPQIRLNPAEAGRKVVDQWLPNVPHPKEERVICMHDSREDRESQIELANQPNSLPASSINPLVSQNEEANGGRYIQAFQKW